MSNVQLSPSLRHHKEMMPCAPSVLLETIAQFRMVIDPSYA
jgi:hypothetical protein